MDLNPLPPPSSASLISAAKKRKREGEVDQVIGPFPPNLVPLNSALLDVILIVYSARRMEMGMASCLRSSLEAQLWIP